MSIVGKSIATGSKLMVLRDGKRREGCRGIGGWLLKDTGFLLETMF